MNLRFTSGLTFCSLFCITVFSLLSCGDEFSEKDAFEQALALSQQRDSIQRAESAKADSIQRVEKAKADSLANVQGQENDSVTVNLRLTSFPSDNLLGAASIEILQTKKVVKQTNADGSISFKMLKANAEIVLKATDHASVRFRYLYDTQAEQSVVFLTLQLPKVTEDSFYTLTGTANAEFDLNAEARYSPVPAGVKIKANLISNFNFDVNTLDDPSIAYVTLFDLPTWEVETTTDENGKYSLSLPSIEGLTLQYRLEFDDFIANQKIAINRFLDVTEPFGKYSLFGDFQTVEVPTQFTSESINSYSQTAYTRIPSNIPVLKIEVVEEPVSGGKAIFIGSIVSSLYESNDYQLGLGRAYRFTKVDSHNSIYPAGTLTLRLTDLRTGTTATTSYENNYEGSLPSTIYLSPNYYYYYSYASSPSQVFTMGPTSYNSIATLTGYAYPYNSYTAANSYIYYGSAYARTPNGLSIVQTQGYGFDPFVYFDSSLQKNCVVIYSNGSQEATMDISYGTGIKTRPVE